MTTARKLVVARGRLEGEIRRNREACERFDARSKEWAEHLDALPVRVLVIDDEPAIRAGIRRELEGAFDAIVVEAGRGREGVRCAQRAFFDLVIVDLDLPDMLGMEVIRSIRRQSLRPLVFVLVISGVARNIGDLARDAGANAFLAKPFSVEELKRAVATAIRVVPRVAPAAAPR